MNRYKPYFNEDIVIPLKPGSHFKYGKFKNKQAVVDHFEKNEKGEDVIITTDNKIVPILKIRLITNKKS